MLLRQNHALVAMVTLLAGCDHATKLCATQELRGEGPVALIPQVLSLRYAENRDVGFSLLSAVPQEMRAVLIPTLVSLLLAGVAVAWYRRRAQAPWAERAGYALLLAGGIGNLLDRLFRGYVVDFVHLHRWPIFNVADVLIVAGVVAVSLAHRKQLKAA